MENQRNFEGTIGAGHNAGNEAGGSGGHHVFYDFMGGSGSGGPMRRSNLSYSSIGAIILNHPYSRYTIDNNPSTTPFRQAEMNQPLPAAAAPHHGLPNFGLFGYPYGSYMPADGTVVYPGSRVEMAGNRQAGDDDLIMMSNPNHPIQTLPGTYNAYGRRVGVPRTSRSRIRAFADYLGLRNPWLRLTQYQHETIAESHRRYAAMEASNSHLYRYDPNPPIFQHLLSDPTLVQTDAALPEHSFETVDQQLPPRTYNPRTMCYFCLYDVSSSRPFGRRACGHLFHVHCAQDTGLQECYLCRARSEGRRRRA